MSKKGERGLKSSMNKTDERRPESSANKKEERRPEPSTNKKDDPCIRKKDVRREEKREKRRQG